MAERFAFYVGETDPETGCLSWVGRKDEKGYGRFRYSDRSRGMGAHIVALMLATGESNDGRHALHHCDNKGCVEPSHLYWGDNAQNMRDRRARREKYSPNNKLVAEQVIDIRNRYADGERMVALATAFGISRTHISSIVRREAWRHVP